MPSRPYISWNVKQLEDLFRERSGEVNVLENLIIELAHRRTRAAAALRELVKAKLSSLPASARPDGVKSYKASGLSRYSAFLSYSRRDTKVVQRVRDAIDKSGLATWLDTEGLAPGDHWEPTLRRALVQSDSVVVFVTENIPGSFVEREIELARDMRKPIIPVVVDDFITTDHPIAIALRQIQYIDFRNNLSEGTKSLLNSIKLFHLAPVISVYSVKGGTGKTTLSAHSAAYFYKKEAKSVLLVDMDPQANLSTLLIRPSMQPAGILRRPQRVDTLANLRGLNKSIYGVLERCASRDAFSDDSDDFSQFIHTLDSERNAETLSIVAGDSRIAQLALTDTSEDTRKIIRTSFSRFIERCRKRYDCVLIDMNPSISHLTILALSAATDIVSPIKPDMYSVQSIDLLNELSGDDEDAANGTGKFIVINQPQLSGDDVVRELIKSSEASDRLLESELAQSKEFFARASRNLAEGLNWMPAFGNWGPTPSPARQSLRKVARELAGKVGMRLSG